MPHELQARCPACLVEEQTAQDAFAQRDIATAKVVGIRARRTLLAGDVVKARAEADKQIQEIEAIKPTLSSTFESLDTAADSSGLQQTTSQSEITRSIDRYKLERQNLTSDLTILTADIRELQEELAGIDAEEQMAQEELATLEESAQSALTSLEDCNEANCGSSNVTETDDPKTFKVTIPLRTPSEGPAEASATSTTDGAEDILESTGASSDATTDIIAGNVSSEPSNG